jgi:LPS-assembly lipoprotein
MSWSSSLRARGGRRPALFAVLFSILLAGCGFTLRGTQQLPFATIALNFPVNSPLGVELARYIRTGTHTQVVEDPTKAAAVFELIAETPSPERQVLTYNAQGRAVEYTLRYRLLFRVRDARGRDIIETTELSAQRAISFNDSQALSKETEEQLLFRDMRSDVVQQVLRRLGAAKPYAAED